MNRGCIVVEGQTEEAFVNQILAPHLGQYGIFVTACRIETGRKGGRIFRGGMSSYEKARRDLQRWLRMSSFSWVSTMFDLYALPHDFPGYEDARRKANPLERVELLEQSFENDIGETHFYPYLQLFEFEALLFSDVTKILDYYVDEPQSCIMQLQAMRAAALSPEHINDGPETAPSKRIIRFLPSYAKDKAIAGPFIAEAIGLDVLRTECIHFDKWVTSLEQLGDRII